MGRLVADPELKKTQNGTSVCSFRIAVDRNVTNKQTGEKPTDFINIIAWRQTAEFVCKYFRKGDMIAIEGSLQTRSYTDKDGNNRTAYDVVANNVSFTGSKSEGAAAPIEMPQATTFTTPQEQDFEVVNSEDEGDDLPF